MIKIIVHVFNKFKLIYQNKPFKIVDIFQNKYIFKHNDPFNNFLFLIMSMFGIMVGQIKQNWIKMSNKNNFQLLKYFQTQ